MPTACAEDNVSWLLEGDAAVRWQVLRDLCASPQKQWQQERRRMETSGWGAKLLRLQDAEGTWSKSLYGKPKWTCTTYTLLLLREMGLPQDCQAVRRGCQALLDRGIDASMQTKAGFSWLAQHHDTCVVGMWVALGCYFNLDDPKLPVMVQYLLSQQMSDGGWNCRKNSGAVHSSLHTTLNVLDGIREAMNRGIAAPKQLKAAEARAIEFMLMHQMYLSDHTGEVIDQAFTKFSFPPRWHYDVLRGLDYLRLTDAIDDPRLEKPFELLQSRRRRSGRWPLQNRHPGKTFFEMEAPGDESRWNTLRAMRCLRARRAKENQCVPVLYS